MARFTVISDRFVGGKRGEQVELDAAAARSLVKARHLRPEATKPKKKAGAKKATAKKGDD